MGEEESLILELRHITKEFPGVKALSDVTVHIKEGTVHALIGENGAGKSTLMKVLTGMYPDYQGEIRYRGQKTTFRNEREALEQGITIVSQELNLVSELTVAENIYLGREPSGKLKGSVDRKKLLADAENLLSMMGIQFKASDKVSSLSVAQRQLVEIIKAISRNARVVVMDEPTSALTDVEIEYLFKQIASLKKRGITIIYISHKLDEIFAVCDYASVLRDGRHIGTHRVKDLTQPEIIRMMVGRSMEDIYPAINPCTDEVVLEVKKLNCKGKFSDISFAVHKGEILGISGMVGAGRSDVASSVFGLGPLDSGEIYLRGKKLKIKSTRDAIANGIVMVTEERAMYGFVGVLSIRDNILLANCDRFAPHLWVRHEEANEAGREICSTLEVKAPDIQTLTGNLSGGNQQKVVLAKWLIRDIQVLIMDEPTRGIDVGAKQEIYRLIAKLAKEGMAVILISSELPEIIGLAHRTLVMAEGEMKGELKKEEITQEKVMRMIIGEERADDERR